MEVYHVTEVQIQMRHGEIDRLSNQYRVSKALLQSSNGVSSEDDF